MGLQLKNNDTRRKFSIVPAFATYFAGNRAIATIDDVNDVINYLNRTNGATQSTGVLLVSQALTVVSGLQSIKSCGDGGSGCWSCKASCSYHDVAAATSFVRTAAGTFLLTVNTADDLDYTKIAVKVGSLTQPGYVATVNQLTATTFEIQTFDILSASLGTPIDNVFDNTPIEITYYYSPFITL